MLKPSKTIVETKKEGNKSLDNLAHKYNSYCCPLCTELPEILCYNQGSGTVKFSCKTHKEMTLEVEEYMEKMAKFEKNSEVKTKNKCSEHNENYLYYCLNCQKNLCKKCLNDPEKKHENHLTYNIDIFSPNKQEILYIKNRIEILLQKKDELERMIKSLVYKITFYDTLLYSYESQNPNFLLNINLKHIVFGEKLNFDEIKNIEVAKDQSKKELFDDFIKNDFLKATKGLNQLTLVNKNMENDLIERLFKGIEDSTIFKILKFNGQIQNSNEIIELKNLKSLNLRGNNISSIQFLANKNFPNLEFLSLNDNEIQFIDNLKKVSFPLLKELYLSKNKIYNIDVLSEFKTPELTILWLANNNIQSIQVLEKVNFPRLLKLSLSKNKITDISIFKEHKAKFPQLYELYLNDNPFESKESTQIIDSLFLKVKQLYY